MSLIFKTTIACPCHVHAMSDVMYLEVGCDTQTFELVVIDAKNFLRR